MENCSWHVFCLFWDSLPRHGILSGKEDKGIINLCIMKRKRSFRYYQNAAPRKRKKENKTDLNKTVGIQLLPYDNVIGDDQIYSSPVPFANPESHSSPPSGARQSWQGVGTSCRHSVPTGDSSNPSVISAPRRVTNSRWSSHCLRPNKASPLRRNKSPCLPTPGTMGHPQETPLTKTNQRNLTTGFLRRVRERGGRRRGGGEVEGERWPIVHTSYFLG